MKKPSSATKKTNTKDAVDVSTAKSIDSAKLVESLATQRRSSKRLNIILVLLLLAATTFGGYMYWRYDTLSNTPQDTTQKNQAETDRVMGLLKKRLLITEQEAPTVARVEDPQKLKSSNQDFYKDAREGDYLVVFPKRAIIYRESSDQIINIAPIVSTAEPTPPTDDPVAP